MQALKVLTVLIGAILALFFGVYISFALPVILGVPVMLASACLSVTVATMLID